MIFDPLSAAALLTLASATPVCEMPKPADIEIIPKSTQLQFDYSKTMQDLQQVQMDTIDPHSFNGVSLTQGFMDGAIRLQPKVSFDYKAFPQYGAVCVWYDKIIIDLEIDPKIVIAREVEEDPCMSKAVTDHEMKHVRVDRELVNQYAKSMGQAIYNELGQRGFVAGPVKVEYAQQILDRMSKTVYQIAEHEYKKMDLERADRQKAVDSLEEYNRVQALCPRFDPFAGQKKHRN